MHPLSFMCLLFGDRILPCTTCWHGILGTFLMLSYLVNHSSIPGLVIMVPLHIVPFIISQHVSWSFIKSICDITRLIHWVIGIEVDLLCFVIGWFCCFSFCHSYQGQDTIYCLCKVARCFIWHDLVGILFKILSLFIYILCVSVFCLHINASYMYSVLGSQRRATDTWNWSYGWLYGWLTPCRCQEPKLGPLQEQPLLLFAELALQVPSPNLRFLCAMVNSFLQCCSFSFSTT